MSRAVSRVLHRIFKGNKGEFVIDFIDQVFIKLSRGAFQSTSLSLGLQGDSKNK